jgi:hypothetical protein
MNMMGEMGNNYEVWIGKCQWNGNNKSELGESQCTNWDWIKLCEEKKHWDNYVKCLWALDKTRCREYLDWLSNYR